MLFQKACVVPFGTTATVNFLAPLWFPLHASLIKRAKTANKITIFFIFVCLVRFDVIASAFKISGQPYSSDDEPIITRFEERYQFHYKSCTCWEAKSLS